jgi:CheY-like chemotaxis protein
MNAAPMPGGPLLVVDDDRLVLMTLTHGLRQAGYEVVEADNGDDAILLARRHQPRLALLDIRMQGLSGFDVAQYLRDYTRTPFLFLSAFADPQTQSRAQALGALGCLDKPVQWPRLLACIEQSSRQGGHGLDSHQAPPAHPQPEPTPWPQDWGAPPLAVGLLMHRHGLDRQGARQRLLDMASAHGRSVEATADELLRAQEILAASGPLGTMGR